MQADFHKLAKDAGNKLRAYMLTYASGATGVFFLALVGKDAPSFTQPQKWLLVSALLLFVLTVILCLIELRIDARRSFHVAKQLDLPKEEQRWGQNKKFKRIRLRLINGTYITSALATLAVIVFLISKIT